MAVDAHCHLADERFSDPLKIVSQAQASGIEYFLMGGVDPQDWKAQLRLSQTAPGVFPVFGVHPYRAAKWSKELLSQAWEELISLHPKAFAIGETGVDARPEYAEQIDRQLEYFRKHIELAIQEEKVLVTHIVRAHNECITELKKFRLKRPIIVHAFNSSAEIASQYTDQGFYLSVGGAVTYENNKKLRQAVLKMPKEQLLIESDSPDQSPCGWQESLNTPKSIYQVAESIGKLWGESAEGILQQTLSNFKHLFSQELRKLSR